MIIDNELIKIVFEDLHYLMDEWTQDIDDASLRRASPVLRSLLIDHQLMKVANMLNEKVNVLLPLISKYDNDFNDPSLVYYQAGGAKYKGIEVQSLVRLNRIKSQEDIKEEFEKQKKYYGQNYSIKLTKFMKQASFVINGIKINREEVVKYIANKRGGVHFDSSRKTDKSGSGKSLENKFILLDGIHNGTIVANKNAVYYELLSIGQRLVGSLDIQRIYKILKNQ